MAWIFVVRPPRDALWRSCRRWREHRRDWRAQALRTAAATIRASPSDETDCRWCRRAIEGRTILPAAANLEDMNDAADHSAIVDPPRAGPASRQKRFDRRPLHVAQPKFIRHGPSPPSLIRLESQPVTHFNSLIECGASSGRPAKRPSRISFRNRRVRRPPACSSRAEDAFPVCTTARPGPAFDPRARFIRQPPPRKRRAPAPPMNARRRCQ